MKQQNRPMVAVLCALGAAIVLPFSDALVKALALAYPIVMIAWARFSISTVMLAVVAWRHQGVKGWRPTAWRLQLLRSLAGSIASLLIFEGFRVLPLAECSAIVFISPVIANLLAWWWLNEKPDHTSWLIAAICFVGVLLIVKPGTELFTAAALYPLFGAIAFASFLVLSRVVTRYDNATTTAFIGSALGTLNVSIALPWYYVQPQSDLDLLLFLGLGAGAGAGNLFISLAYQYGKTHLVAPISYTSLIIVTALGYFFFDELPSALTITGMFIILISGVALVLHSGKRRHR